MKISIASDLKTRTGAPDKDARIKNGYIEVAADGSAALRRRPSVHGGVPSVSGGGAGQGQGGIGFSNGGVSYLITIVGDTANGSAMTSSSTSITPSTASVGTTWSSSTTYAIGDHVVVNFVDYWASAASTSQTPSSSSSYWSTTFVPSVYLPITYATWNPADKTFYGVLSANNLTIHDANTYAVRSTISKSSGKWYWEYTIGQFDNVNNFMMLGIATSLADLANSQIGFDIYGWAYAEGSGINGNKLHNSVFSNYGSIYAPNDVIGVALDMDTGIVQFYLNNVGQGIAYSGLSGSIFAGVGNISYGGTNDGITANFGETAFTYTPPSGYNSGLYT